MSLPLNRLRITFWRAPVETGTSPVKQLITLQGRPVGSPGNESSSVEPPARHATSYVSPVDACCPSAARWPLRTRTSRWLSHIPPNTLATGTPAEVRREVEDSPWAYAGDRYVELSREHMESSEILD